MHRDISMGNILIVGEGENVKGLLIDWERGKEIEGLDVATQQWRSVSSCTHLRA